MDFVAVIFLLFVVMLIGGVILLVVATGVGSVLNSVSSLIETLDDFTARSDHSSPSPTSKAL